MTEELPRPPDSGGAETLKLTLTKRPYTEITRRLDTQAFPDQPISTQGGLPCTVQNIEYMINELGIVVRFNVITKKVEIRIPGHSGSVENAANTALTEINSLTIRHGISIGQVPAIIELLADRNLYNPVQVWIDSRPWDGVDRLPEICATLVTAEDFPLAFKDTLIRKWLLAAAAAALKPSGFRCRGVLTLQGAQGLGKTSWVRKLVSDLALCAEVVKLDHHLDGGNKDSLLSAIAHWIVEIGELESSFKRDIARLKGFLTNDIDKIRKPYAKAEVEHGRRTVFCATVNSYDFLVDGTGNARFWTLPLIDVDHEHNIDTQQLFAQMAASLRAGDQWWLTDEEEVQLAYRNARHRAFSPVLELLQGVIDFDAQPGDDKVAKTATEVLKMAGVERPTNPQAKECGALLREHFGSPKRIRGRDKWQVPLRSNQDRDDWFDEFSD